MGFSFYKFMSFGSKREMWFYISFLVILAVVVGYSVVAFSTPDFSKSSGSSGSSGSSKDAVIQRVEVKIVDEFIDVGDY